jgi:hypothetical protein
LLKDLGFISDVDKIDVIDANKIKREKSRICTLSVKDREPDLQELTCIGLDSKKDNKV